MIVERDDVGPGGPAPEKAGGDGLDLAPRARQTFTEKKGSLLGAPRRNKLSEDALAFFSRPPRA